MIRLLRACLLFVALMGLWVSGGGGRAADAQALSDCDRFFAEYGLAPFDEAALPDPFPVKTALREARLFRDEPCRQASMVLDVEAAAAASDIDFSRDITGVYVNENMYFAASGDLQPGFEILDIEHFYAGLILTQYMIGPASMPDAQGDVVYPIRISRLRTRVDDQGRLTHNPALSTVRYYADVVSRDRAADLAWKSALNYWDGVTQLRQAGADKLMLAFEPQGAQRAVFDAEATRGLATFRPTNWEALDITQRMLAAEAVSLRYFPCVLRKVERRFEGETIAWISALDALAQSERLAEEQRSIKRRLRSALVLGQEDQGLRDEQTALDQRRAAFERSANGQLFAALAAQGFGCLEVPQ